jgi:hypothetical protein
MQEAFTHCSIIIILLTKQIILQWENQQTECEDSYFMEANKMCPTLMILFSLFFSLTLMT